MQLPGNLDDLSNLIRSRSSAGFDGRGIARKVAMALNVPDDPINDGGEEGWQPTPLAPTFLAALEASGPLSRRQAEAAAGIVQWYGIFWAQHRELCTSPTRVRLLLESIREYATQRRSAVFRPYYEALSIEPALFGQWVRDLDRNGFLPAARESASWRGPIASIRAFRYLLLDAEDKSIPGDYHACGSASFFLLGDADFNGFDISSCWICPGTKEQACGELCVDVRD